MGCIDLAMSLKHIVIIFNHLLINVVYKLRLNSSFFSYEAQSNFLFPCLRHIFHFTSHVHFTASETTWVLNRMKISRMCLLSNLMIISKTLSNYIKPLILLISKKKIPCITCTGHWKLKEITQKETSKHSWWITLKVFCIITSHSA